MIGELEVYGSTAEQVHDRERGRKPFSPRESMDVDHRS